METTSQLRPFFETHNGILYQNSCLEIMRNFDDKSIDFVFTDPPYNVNKPYDSYNDNLPASDYIDFLNEIICEIKRITKNGFCFLVGYKILKIVWDLMPEARLVIIQKRAIGSYDKYYFHQYFGLLATAEPYLRTYDLWTDIRLPTEGYFFREKRYDHPAYTGKALTKKVIDVYSKEDDIVLDPFAGTGTTAVACEELSRKWIAIEISQYYCDIAKARLKQIEEGFQERLWVEEN